LGPAGSRFDRKGFLKGMVIGKVYFKAMGVSTVYWGLAQHFKAAK